MVVFDAFSILCVHLMLLHRSTPTRIQCSLKKKQLLWNITSFCLEYIYPMSSPELQELFQYICVYIFVCVYKQSVTPPSWKFPQRQGMLMFLIVKKIVFPYWATEFYYSVPLFLAKLYNSRIAWNNFLISEIAYTWFGVCQEVWYLLPQKR